MTPDHSENSSDSNSLIGKSLIVDMVNRFNKCEHLEPGETICMSIDEIEEICRLATELYMKEDSLLARIGSQDPNEHWAVLGDVHGQYTDMIGIMKTFLNVWFDNSSGVQTKYLFLGDYVDRGSHSLEVIISLLCWKILRPDQICLLRGNHECLTVNGRYGFKNECLDVFGPLDGLKAWIMINNVFDYMPLAAVLNEEYFCVHGGISENLQYLSDIENIPMPFKLREGCRSIANCMMWADPNRDGCIKDFDFNPKRGPRYGANAVQCFFKRNPGLKKILRGHQTAANGFWECLNKSVVTVFSAPDYRGIDTNDAAILVVRPTMDDTVLQISKNEGEFSLKAITIL